MTGKILTLLGIAGLFLFVKYYLGPVGLPFPGGSPSLNILGNFSIFRCLVGFILGMFLFTLYNESIGYNFFRKSWVFTVFFFGALIAMQLGIEDILVIAIFPFIILSAAYNTTTIKKFLDFPFLQRLGDWSFSIYMVHVPLIYLFWIYQTLQNPTYFGTFPPPEAAPENYSMGWWLCLTLVAFTLLLASLTHKYIEVPARIYLNKRFAPKELEPVKVVN
jgi:peptidoglycan/LPS O-acetylase OafA/YrhL